MELRVVVAVRLSRLDGVEVKEGPAEDELDGEGSDEDDGSSEDVGSEVWDAEKDVRAEREEDTLDRSENVVVDDPETELVELPVSVPRTVFDAILVAVPETVPLLVEETDPEEEID